MLCIGLMRFLIVCIDLVLLNFCFYNYIDIHIVSTSFGVLLIIVLRRLKPDGG